MPKYAIVAVLSDARTRIGLFDFFLGQIVQKCQILPLGGHFSCEILLPAPREPHFQNPGKKLHKLTYFHKF